MADHDAAPGSPSLAAGEEPQALNDPGDVQNASIEEEHGANPPIDEPTADPDAFDDDEAPETVEAMNQARSDDERNQDSGAGSDDDDSDLEELDEAEFEDFDPSALKIPVAIDEGNVGLIGVHKRKRTEEEEQERKKKKKLEKRRQKPKRSGGAVEGVPEGGVDEGENRRARKNKEPRPKKRATTPEDEETLTPEERRRRALDRKMDEALRTNKPSRRRGGIDLEAAADAEIETMRQKMAKACELDAEARARGDVATHKLRILPQVVELMNRNTIQAQLVDPDINILEAVRFMLEPADHDAALPNYQIQRELFSILSKLNISKEALTASGVGKVVLFYTKSIQPQPEIKRLAEKLIGEWMRVVLKKRKDRRNIQVKTQMYDPLSQSQRSRTAAPTEAERAALAVERRRKALAAPGPANRARVEGNVGTYTVAPVSTLSNAIGPGARKVGASGEDAFRRIAARSAGTAKR